MAEILTCRLCHNPLSAETGCAVCLAVKPHLTVSSALDEESAPLALVASEAVAVLRRQLKKLRDTKEPTPGDRSEMRAITNAISKVMDSARKVIQDGADAVDAMSFQEKLALFAEWAASLPAAHRRRVIDMLEAQAHPAPKAVERGSASTDTDTSN